MLADTLLVCWRRLDEVPDHEVLPWAYGVARNCLANAQRGSRRQGRVAAKIAVVDPPVEVAPGDDGASDEVRRALARLPARDAEMLRLWAWEQLGPGEIAVVLDITPNAVSIRLHRAREKLREELRKMRLDAGHEGSRRG